MDYTQRHFEECADVKQSGDKNQDMVLLIPNFSLMERFLVIGGNDPNTFYKNILKSVYPANRKQSVSPISLLKNEIESRKQLPEGKEDSGGLFGLFKETLTEDPNAIGNWFERTVTKCGAIKFLRTSSELYEVMKSRHLNFFESIIQTNIRKEADSIPLIAFEFWHLKINTKTFVQ